MTALQEKCLEKEATNEDDSKDDDELHIVTQMEMGMSNAIVSRTLVSWSAHIAI